MDPLSRPATDMPLNHTPRPTLPPMTKDPFLLHTIPPPPPSPTKSRIADIFHRRRQASRQQQQQQQTYPQPPTSMPAAAAAFTDPTTSREEDMEMAVLATNQHQHHNAKNTDSTSTSMGTPKSPHHPAAAPAPTVSLPLNGHRSAPVVAASSARGKAGGVGYRGSLLEGVRYSAGGEPVGWYEMFEKTRKFEGGFVETKEGGVRCIHPCAWGEDEWGEYVCGGASGGGGEGRVVGRGAGEPAGVGEEPGNEGLGHGSGGDGSAPHPQGGDDGEWGGNVGPQGGGNVGPQGGMDRADSETLGSGRFGETILPTESRSAALRAGLIGLDCGDGGDDEDEGEGGPSRGGSNAMEMIKVILDEGPPSGMMGGGSGRVGEHV